MSYPQFTPDVVDEHADDGRDLDIEIMGAAEHDGPRMPSPGDTYAEMDSETLGNAEIAGLEQEAILRTLKTARDHRRPCPPMQAVDLDAPLHEQRDVIGEALSSAPAESYPLWASLTQAYQAAGKPRIVRIDTEESFAAFRTTSSPEMRLLSEHVAAMEHKLQAHLQDPDAHTAPPIAPEDLEEAAELQEAVGAIEEGKRIPLRMPAEFDGLMDAWHQDGMACSSMLLPRSDGKRWVATASESLDKGTLEAARAATEAGVPATAIVGYLPAIGASLAQADATKSLASGAEEILRRPEAQAGKPFMVRLEPKASPALLALGELAYRCCCLHEAAACEEWNRLAQAAPAPLRQAMAEILAVLKPQPASPLTAIGGAVGDFFQGLWDKVRHLLGSGHPGPKGPSAAPALVAAPVPKALPAHQAAA